MKPFAIVKHFNVINDVSSGLSRFLYCEKKTLSVLRLPKKLSATALTLLCQGSKADSFKSAKIIGYNSLTTEVF